MTAYYTTLQDILEEAGLHHVENGVALSGVVDGINTTFTTDRKPITDRNFDDTVTVDDFVVFVDGVPVKAVSVNEAFGVIELEKAPKNDSVVTIDYSYASVPLRVVELARKAAMAWIDKSMEGVDPCAPYGKYGREIPGRVVELCTNYAAARLLIREYGFNQDIEGTSKDGYKRLEVVKQDMQEFVKSGGVCGDGSDDLSAGLGAVGVRCDVDLFGDFPDRRHPHNDNCYERED